MLLRCHRMCAQCFSVSVPRSRRYMILSAILRNVISRSNVLPRIAFRSLWPLLHEQSSFGCRRSPRAAAACRFFALGITRGTKINSSTLRVVHLYGFHLEHSHSHSARRYITLSIILARCIIIQKRESIQRAHVCWLRRCELFQLPFTASRILFTVAATGVSRSGVERPRAHGGEGAKPRKRAWIIKLYGEQIRFESKCIFYVNYDRSYSKLMTILLGPSENPFSLSSRSRFLSLLLFHFATFLARSWAIEVEVKMMQTEHRRSSLSPCVRISWLLTLVGSDL